ncbi:hypothetical protein CTI12_AA403140 [Artemisia annua]|uniref:DUF4408 domain-containing protein n=1 Tax=Artemisia annua TaxID=35608 RepID=A0A2U1MAT9_ARTAN|nr:hypothetical protein CTI12_AA403140 [Artemisia annua]
MGSRRLHSYEIHPIKKPKNKQFVSNVWLYILSTLLCTMVCFFSLPNIFSFVFTSKFLFIVGNLIVIFLVGESKFFDSNPKTACKRHELRALSCKSERSFEEKRTSANVSYGKVKSCKTNDEWESLPAEELTELADDFIARMNRLTRLEAQCCF